jgi:hypothetical protein
MSISPEIEGLHFLFVLVMTTPGANSHLSVIVETTPLFRNGESPIVTQLDDYPFYYSPKCRENGVCGGVPMFLGIATLFMVSVTTEFAWFPTLIAGIGCVLSCSLGWVIVCLVDRKKTIPT